MFDLVSLIKTVGYAGLFGIIFAESGLFVGFFLPGDSLLFTAGFLASQGFLNIWTLIVLCFVAAALGDNVGYAFGKKVGPKIFHREDSFFFHRDHIERARAFYARYGAKTIFLARFIPIVRTFAPIIAGVGTMNYPSFLAWNLLGSIAWAIGVPLIGYFLGSVVPNIDRFLLPIIALIIFFSVLPMLLHLMKDHEMRKHLIESIKKKLRKNPC